MVFEGQADQGKQEQLYHVPTIISGSDCIDINATWTKRLFLPFFHKFFACSLEEGASATAVSTPSEFRGEKENGRVYLHNS